MIHVRRVNDVERMKWLSAPYDNRIAIIKKKDNIKNVLGHRQEPRYWIDLNHHR